MEVGFASFLLLLCASCYLVSSLSSVPSSEPNPIYEASKYSSKVREVKNGALYQVEAPNQATLTVLHLYGNATERGFAQGQLLSSELTYFAETKLNEFFDIEANQLLKYLKTLPVWLQDLIKAIIDKDAPGAFRLGLDYVLSQQKDHIGASKANIWDEVDGMARGICSVSNNSQCNVTALRDMISQVNMLPELIQMQCSMMGAWGPATPNGGLVQLRSLDFGGGPFADYSILVVHHPTDSPTSFASLSFPGFVGAVTGFSEHISQSEKVDDVTGGPRPAGSYAGQGVSMVIRDMLQFSTSKEDAVAIAQAANRTWSVWLGVGDYQSQRFLAMLYDRASALPYDDKTLPGLTNQTQIDSVAYIDRHPQPSPHPEMPALVKQMYGNITADNVAGYFPHNLRTGDVHIAVYDFTAKRVLIATGQTNATGDYTRMACDAPFLAFDMEALWAEPKPAMEL